MKFKNLKLRDSSCLKYEFSSSLFPKKYFKVLFQKKIKQIPDQIRQRLPDLINLKSIFGYTLNRSQKELPWSELD